LSSRVGFPDFIVPALGTITLMEKGARVMLSSMAAGAEVVVYSVPEGKTAFLMTLHLYARNKSLTEEGYIEVSIVSDAARYKLIYLPVEAGGLVSGLIVGGIVRLAPGEQLVIASSISDLELYVTVMIIEV
jgi:hypothetical protein